MENQSLGEIAPSNSNMITFVEILQTMLDLNLQPITLRIERPGAHIYFPSQNLTIFDCEKQFPSLMFVGCWFKAIIDLNDLECIAVDGNHRFQMRNLKENTIYWFHIDCKIDQIHFYIEKKKYDIKKHINKN